VLWAINEKTAIAGGFLEFVSTSFCCCVNLPLLHRRWAGMAKPKIKAEEDSAVHGSGQAGAGDAAWVAKCSIDYNNNVSALASPYFSGAPSCANGVQDDRLRQADSFRHLTQHA
jgi:hypothetical protein